LRVQFRALLSDGRFMRSLSATERDAIRAVVRGSPAGNWLRRLGVLGGGQGIQHTVLGATTASGFGAAGGAAIGGVPGAMIGAAAPILIGRGAASAAEGMTSRAAQRARDVIASGAARGAPRPVLPGPVQSLALSRPGGQVALGLPIADQIIPRSQPR
jgi:hypothetical protein